MNILVTGGAGFIGSNLVHFLLRKDAADMGADIQKVVTLDKLTYAGTRENLADLDADARHVFVQGDICDAELVASLLREHRIDAVMHLAAESHVDRSIASPEAFIMTNVVGTHVLLEQTRRYWLYSDSGITAPRFLHVSTDEVFGSLDADAEAFRETTPYAPNSPYSASKAASDHLARAYHRTYGFPAIITNCSNNYGPYQLPEKLIPLMITRLLAGESLPLYGDGLHVRDWLYVEDHCRALLATLLRGSLGESYVIGGKCEMPNLAVAHAIIRTVREFAPERVPQDAETLIQHVQDRPGHDRRYAIAPERIERELGWSPRENFESGIRKTVRWYLGHPDWLHTTTERLRREG